MRSARSPRTWRWSVASRGRRPRTWGICKSPRSRRSSTGSTERTTRSRSRTRRTPSKSKCSRICTSVAGSTAWPSPTLQSTPRTPRLCSTMFQSSRRPTPKQFSPRTRCRRRPSPLRLSASSMPSAISSRTSRSCSRRAFSSAWRLCSTLSRSESRPGSLRPSPRPRSVAWRHGR
eukprot:Amastigsp_a508550_293.p3 type:complete len:175 gc:universal Amastigsp_a508550_293:526-1050(+)